MFARDAIGPGDAVDFDPFAGPALESTAPTTESQREIWTAVQLGPDASCAFNESWSLQLIGSLDVSALRGALGDLVARHEALRATTSPDGTTLCLLQPTAIELPIDELSSLSETERRRREEELLQREVEEPFSLEQGPLFRARLLRFASDRHLLVCTAHHLICDGFSTAVILKELAALYTARKRSTAAALPPPFPFSAYARELAEREQTAEHAADQRYWLERFSSIPSALELPLDRSRPRVKSYPSRRCDHTIGREVVEAVKRAGARSGASFFTTLLAAYDVLLHRLSGQDDLVVGIPAAGQAATGHAQLVGHCVNTLSIRCSLNGDEPFTSLLGRVRGAMLDAQEHQLFTLGSLLRALAVPRDPSRLPLVSVFFNLDQGFTEGSLPFDGLRASFRTNPRHFENFDLFLNALEQDGELTFECQYNTDLFDHETVRRWLQSLERILREVGAHPELAIDRIPWVPPSDERRLASWNQTHRDYPHNRLVHQLVEEQVDRTPDAVAATFGDQSLTYRELDRRANRLAHHLRALGVGPEVLVGLSLERSLDMLVALLAVQKAGGAYVPLDPAFPAERLAFMVADSRMPVVVTQRSLRSKLPPHQARVVELDGADREALEQRSDRRPSPSARPENLAYVLYTSGSTGKPKGVQVPIRAVVNFLWSVRGEPGLSAGEALVAVTTLSFDIAVLELWLPLVVGARIALASREISGDGALLRSLLDSTGARAMQATPATWRLLLGAGWNGGAGFKIICGGEPLPADLADQLVTRGEVWNMYGPTETTVWSTCYRLPRPPGPIFIGRPLANTRLHLLDRLQQPVPIGVPGELYLGGDGVTRGYLNRPELTAERFLPDPYASEPGARLYRTGDLARLRSDGNLEFLGRNDNQVKVRGFRIELGEIEVALASHPAVAQAVAAVRELRPGDVRLVGYVVERASGRFDEEALREHLRRSLPEYMVPQHLVSLPSLPLTPNGKIDRKALPTPQIGNAPAEEYVAPRNDSERIVAEIWQESLGIGRIGVHDDFFKLGGHSLLAAQAVARLARDHGITIPLRRMFEASTIAQFAPLLAGERQTVSIQRLPDQARAPASFMQERMWNLEQLHGGRAVFNLPAAFRLRGALDLDALERSLQAFFQRHEATRTTLHADGHEVYQEVAPELSLRLQPTDLSGLPPEVREQELMKRLVTEAIVPFDLEKGPLVRAHLFRLAPEEHALFFMPHHAIWDGWSFDILVRDWSELYSALRQGRPAALPQLSLRYRDFAAWHHDWLTSPEVEKQAEYWRRQLSGAQPLELPTDRPRPRTLGDAGATLWIEIPRAEADALTALGQRHGATPFMVMLAAYQTLLHRYSGQEEILVGTPLRGRSQPGLEDLAGTFVNTLVLRTHFDGSPSFIDLLSRVRTTVVDAFAHEDVPFELLAMSHQPVYRALFSYQDVRGRATRFGDLTLEQIHVLPAVAANDVSLWVMESDAGLKGGLNFSTELFDPATMEHFLASFRTLLRSVQADPSCPVSRLAIAERKEISASAGAADAPLLHQELERQVASVGERSAVIDGRRTLSYSELRERIGTLARQLRSAGVGPEVRVGLLARLSLESVVGAAAIAQAGGTCVPLDPADPPERSNRILREAKAAAIVTARGSGRLIPDPGVRVLTLETPEVGAAESGPWPGALDGTAVILYVSDPRGDLVGVELSYRTLSGAVAGVRSTVGLSPSEIFLATGSPASGAGLVEGWLALTSGATLVLDEEAAEDAERFRRVLTSSGATAAHAPVWSWRRLLDSSWKAGAGFKALCNGPVSVELSRKLTESTTAAFCLSGSAETGIWSSAARLGAKTTAATIGDPLPGLRWQVVDRFLAPVPIGAKGELLVGGAGLARGHGGRPALDAERFVQLPGDGTTRFCRTGEQVRLRANGAVEPMTRVDQQFRIRGRRLEAAEVERALENHPAVRQAAVTVCADTVGEERLVAYVARQPSEEVTDSELRDHLRERLPTYMVPRTFVALDTLPIRNGQLDRSALPTPFRSAEASEPIEPRTEMEKFLAQIWREALGTSRIGVRDNFFDLGGHSLLCLQLVARIEKRTGKRLSPRILLLSTLEQVAAQLDTIAVDG